MTVRAMPPQVAIDCDKCSYALGEDDDGYTILLPADLPGEIADALEAHGWRTVGERHYCSACAESRDDG